MTVLQDSNSIPLRAAGITPHAAGADAWIATDAGLDGVLGEFYELGLATEHTHHDPAIVPLAGTFVRATGTPLATARELGESYSTI